MTEIISSNRTEGVDAWQAWHYVRRDDGEEVAVEASCTGTAAETARAQENRETMAFIADRGEAEALRLAETAQSPAVRGNVLVRVFVNPQTGSLMHDYDYERSL